MHIISRAFNIGLTVRKSPTKKGTSNCMIAIELASRAGNIVIKTARAVDKMLNRSNFLILFNFKLLVFYPINQFFLK